MNLKKFEVALERTSKNARAIGDQNLKFVSGELHKTSESFTATVDREPQKFEEVLERTSKNARAIGDQNLKFVSGGDLQPTSEDCSPLSLAQDAETRLRTYRRPRKQAGKGRTRKTPFTGQGRTRGPQDMLCSGEPPQTHPPPLTARVRIPSPSGAANDSYVAPREGPVRA